MNLERVAQVAARECVRQWVGLDRLVYLLHAYRIAYGYAQAGFTVSTLRVGLLAEMIEPSNGGEYRRVPVGFVNAGSCAPVEDVEPRMKELFSWADEMSAVGHVDGYVLTPDGWIREFLWVHPFTDGNGRTAWVLRTWLLDQWDEPEPLPDYFG